MMICKHKKCFKIIFVIYLLLVLVITLIIRETLEFRGTDNRQLILTPFYEMHNLITATKPIYWFMQILLNIILFIPLGVFLPFMYYPYKKLFLLTALTGLICSVAIETTQYITARGITEFDDVINNTLGAMIGFGIYKLIIKKVAKK